MGCGDGDGRVGAAVEIGDWGRNGAAATILAAGAGVLTGCKRNIIIIIVSTHDIFIYVTQAGNCQWGTY
jgi:hypothetical protein